MQVSYTAKQLEIQPLLAAANINPESFLATDYLNHFNEIVMLLEMIPDMPELMEDAADWAPKSYPQHFNDSGFQAKDLAIEAYALAPSSFRDEFENLCGKINASIQATLQGLKAVNIVERGVSPAAQALIRQRIEDMQNLLLQLNQVIHGKYEEQRTETYSEPSSEEVQSQEDIDKLFD
ncbi:hypothetical protein [Kordiimonas aquimaris]|uniref:hypothetical protein n=1 Tax=Kordiimonas aquimaris TaxID=707591 RepID=UPI0021D058E9|nr:hypothetical protein [Kordiimonas aquimaris]